MTGWLIGESVALVFLLAASAFFSSAETTLFALNPIHLHRIGLRHPSAAGRLRALLARPAGLLSSILIGNTVVNVTASALGYVLAEQLAPSRGEAIAIPAMTIVLLIFGEVAPKRLAMSHGERWAHYFAGPLLVVMRAVTPLRVVLEWLAGRFHKELSPGNEILTEDEFRTVVEVGEEEGVLDEEERTMVDGIIRLEETQAKDVMTPRVDLEGIDVDDPPEEQERTARGNRYRYLPIYRDSPDNIIGFLDVPRFLLAGNHDLEAARIGPFFVPETVPLDTLLATFQREGRRVAVVVDEYGGTAGLVTRGDILEEIADDVDDEYGEARSEIQPMGDQRWLVNGSTSLEEINYELDLNLEAEGADRIAGWVTSQLERIPRAGDTVEGQGCRATVQRARKRRVLLVLIERLPPDAAGETEADS